MEQSNEIARLLEEIRDIHREHLAEYKRVSQQMMDINKAYMDTNRAASEEYASQHKDASKSAQSMWWAMIMLIVVCVAANLVILARITEATR